MRSIYISMLVLVCVITPAKTSFGQVSTHQFEQIDSLQKIQKRNIIVFIHTDWCKYCQAMQNTTFKNENIIHQLNEKFYFIDFNAEEEKSIRFNGHTFKYKPTGPNTGIHELAEQLATIDGKVSYPTICILNSNYEIVFQYNHFLSSKDLLRILSTLQKQVIQ